MIMSDNSKGKQTASCLKRKTQIVSSRNPSPTRKHSHADRNMTTGRLHQIPECRQCAEVQVRIQHKQSSPPPAQIGFYSSQTFTYKYDNTL